LADWLLCLGLFGLALWLRIIDLTHFVTADEHNWIYRSGIFLHAFLQKDWSGTSVWLTPGVTTTWLGSISLTIYCQLHEAAINQPFLEWLVSIPRNKIDLDILLALRWSMALTTAVMVAVVYGLARKLWSRPLAVLGTLFLLAEPHLLAVSRIIGHDALITFFTMGSLLSFFYARRLLFQFVSDSYGVNPVTITHSVAATRWFVLSGIFAGLAILSKAPALILIPFIALIALVDVWQDKNRLKLWIGNLLIWGGVLWLTFILLWPAAWVNPLGQTWLVVKNAFLSSAGLEDADIQPYWSIPDPGYFYYLINGAFIMSPFLMLGAILAGYGAWRHLGYKKISMSGLATIEFWWLFLFAVLFGLMMTLGVKKSPRYILPAFPALIFVAAWGWLFVLHRFRKAVTVAVLGGLTILFTLNYAPYYFTYYNPLLGGSFTAPKMVRIGWGEGLDEVGRWLKAQPNAAADHIGARYTATLYPFYEGSISSPISDELDYVAFYIKQSQSGYPSPEILAYFAEQKPLHQVMLNGIEYAQVYRGPGMTLVQATDKADLPIAYRPYTIYAPIGEHLTIDLLWSDNVQAQTEGKFVNLALKSVDASTVLASQAVIVGKASGVKVSTHNFELPADMARDTYTLLVDDKPLGEIKARLMSLPTDFEPFSAVMAGQLKLAGFRQRTEGNHLLVDLAWQGWPKATNDYTVFIQLLDANQQRITGVDTLPERGFTTLDRKELMITHDVIPVTDDLKPGTYNLLVGLYYFAGDELVNVGAVTLEEPAIVE